MKMRNVRKCCRLHAKLAENQIGICLVCAGMMALTAVAGGVMLLLLMGIFLLLGALWFFARACRIIFGAASYEAAGDFVRALPLSEKELFAGKILTGSLLTFCLFLFLEITQIGIARDFESTSFDWRTFTMCSPLILLTLMLLSLCAAALYSIGMALTYQRGEENDTMSIAYWVETIVVILSFLVLFMPLMIPIYHSAAATTIKKLLILAVLLAISACLLVRGAVKTFHRGSTETCGAHARRRSGGRTKPETAASALPHVKAPARMYAWLLRQCDTGSLAQQGLWSIMFACVFMVQNLPAVLIPLLPMGIGARIQYERDNAMLYGENAPFYQLFPLSARQKVLLHIRCGCRTLLPLLLIAVNGYCVFLIFSHRMPPTRFDAAVLCFLLLNCALLTGAALCSGIVMFSVSFGNLWRDALTHRPSLLAGGLCESGIFLGFAVVYLLLCVHANIPKAALFSILTVLNLSGFAVFYRLNVWMLEKKYAV